MIEVVTADITSLAVDAIVNAANESLLGGGGVDGAIHRAAGPELLEFCRHLGGCPTGEARLTPGFRRPAKWFIHTGGPVWRGGVEGEAQQLASCYQSVFAVARQYNIRSIAFSAISTGVYGYPKTEAAQIALCEMRAVEPEFERLIACCFSSADAEIYLRLLGSYTHAAD